MALNTFTPATRLGFRGGVPVFLDPACTVRAAVLDLNGNPWPGNLVPTDEAGVVKGFQVNNVATVYYRHDSGAILSHASGGVPVLASSGSKNATLATVVTGI